MSTATSAPAAAASAVSAELQPPRFRTDEDVGFPPLGLALLAVLFAVAIGLVIFDKRRRNGRMTPPAGLARYFAALRLSGTGAAGSVQVLSSTRLDASTRLHVIDWEGRRLLVATQGGHPPVVLDRQGEAPAAAPAEPGA